MENTYATKAAFAACAGGVRRFKEVDLPIVGRVILQSLTAGEFTRVDAARTRAMVAASTGKNKDQCRALNDGLVELVTIAVLDREKNPLFGPDDRSLILGLDTSVSQPLVTACIEHCRLDADDVGLEAAEKN